MIHRHSPGSTRRLTPGADKGFDSARFTFTMAACNLARLPKLLAA